MDSTDKPWRGSGSRPPEVTERLQRSRDRLRDLRAAQRLRERLVGAAVKEYLAAWQAISRIEQSCDGEVADLQQQILDAKARAQIAIAEHHQQQAVAAAAIRAHGHSDEETAELLEISVKQARRLIAAVNVESTSRESSTDKPSTTSRALREIDAVVHDDAPIIGEEPAVEQRSDDGSDQMR
ncbi:hypothetical protein [Nocardia sp. NPDC050435]|uniref:hypothetical protein n=1 Tax=Nocardia sp. NPDC050435 TaxID=3155040 RepID=UPI0033F924B6